MHLTPEQGRYIIKAFCAQKIQKIEMITFFGGEPTAYPETIRAVCEVCEQMYVAGKLSEIPQFSMITNCASLSPACIDIIRRYHIKLTISLDGPQCINDSLRVDKSGHGTFERVLKNIT